MSSISLSDFRYTRCLARAYRASEARQLVAPQQWREEGLLDLSRQLQAAMDWWADQGLIRVYDRAVIPDEE